MLTTKAVCVCSDNRFVGSGEGGLSNCDVKYIAL